MSLRRIYTVVSSRFESVWLPAAADAELINLTRGPDFITCSFSCDSLMSTATHHVCSRRATRLHEASEVNWVVCVFGLTRGCRAWGQSTMFLTNIKHLHRDATWRFFITLLKSLTTQINESLITSPKHGRELCFLGFYSQWWTRQRLYLSSIFPHLSC